MLSYNIHSYKNSYISINFYQLISFSAEKEHDLSNIIHDLNMESTDDEERILSDNVVTSSASVKGPKRRSRRSSIGTKPVKVDRRTKQLFKVKNDTEHLEKKIDPVKERPVTNTIIISSLDSKF